MITINATGDTTLHTAGKYCPEDILVKVPPGGTGVDLPALTNEGSAEELFYGKELIGQSGNKITGTFTIEDELDTIDTLITQIQTNLQNKAAGGEVILQNKTVTPTADTQYITADSGYDALGTVTINGDSNLRSSNIVKGVSIFGVNGSYSGGGGADIATVSVSIRSAQGAIATYTVFLSGSFEVNTNTAINVGGSMYRHMLANIPVNTLILVNVGGATVGGGGIVVESTSNYTLIQAIATSTCCFVAGTQVLVSLDGKTVSIESLKEGDDVVSYNVETKENYVAKVRRLIIKENVTDIAEVYFDNGTSLTMNAYHPIYTTNGFRSLTNHKGYETLYIGDIAKTVDGWSEITEIKRYNSEPIIMYNLDVVDVDEIMDDESNDTFYANNIVVHNADDLGSGDC